MQELHPRDRLLHRIESATNSRRNIWIGAPAGAGKTSLAALCAARFKCPVIWFRVEAADRDMPSFIGNLYAATGLRPPQSAPFKADFDSLRDALHDQADYLPADALWVWDGCEQLDDASLQWQALADLMRYLPNLPPCFSPAVHPRRQIYCHSKRLAGWRFSTGKTCASRLKSHMLS